MFGLFGKKKENFIKIGVQEGKLKIDFNLHDKSESEAVVGLLISLISGNIHGDILKSGLEFSQKNPEWSSQIQQVIAFFQQKNSNDFILPLEVFEDV